MGFDVTILNLALPSMAEDLHADNAQLQWFVTVYTPVLAAGIFSAARAALGLGAALLMPTRSSWRSSRSPPGCPNRSGSAAGRVTGSESAARGSELAADHRMA
ncbi:hypothetical protein [Nonomuraea sp. NPDC003709]|uniref:hypothetical protein n=1 Tax=Nonomuraea sp. NPDC003709 TaxID=3154450 RepID=UPI0033A004B3